MYQLILLSVCSNTTLGIYLKQKNDNPPRLIYSITLTGMTSHTLPLLFSSLFADISSFISSSQSNILKSCILQECVIDVDFFTTSGYSIPAYTTHSKQENPPLIKIICTLQEALYFLMQCGTIESIYYARGVGSLSAIKLTHVFLHTISLSKNIPIYATNSFYFSPNKEIKAFGNMSFFLAQEAKQKIIITDSNLHCITLQKSIKPDEKLQLPHTLLQNDFCEPCTPLYITPAL